MKDPFLAAEFMDARRTAGETDPFLDKLRRGDLLCRLDGLRDLDFRPDDEPSSSSTGSKKVLDFFLSIDFGEWKRDFVDLG